MAEIMRGAKVIPLPPLPQILSISTIQSAVAYGDAWREYARRMESLLALAILQREASEALLRIAEDELARVMGV